MPLQSGLTYDISYSDIIREPKFLSSSNQFPIAGMEFEEHLVSVVFFQPSDLKYVH